jgi:hypothetical protein
MEKGKQPMLNLIGISGKIGSGKDTTAELIQLVTTYGLNHASEIRAVASRLLDDPELTKFTVQNCNWKIVKYAYKLKQIASLLSGIPIENFESQEFKKTLMSPEWSNPEIGDITVRQFLQTLGTNALRDQLHEDVWINALFSDFKGSDTWLITDVRFPNEAEAIKKKGGIVVRVDRGLSSDEHPSETALDNYEFDYIIPNKGDKIQLLEEVMNFVSFYQL